MPGGVKKIRRGFRKPVPIRRVISGYNIPQEMMQRSSNVRWGIPAISFLLSCLTQRLWYRGQQRDLEQQIHYYGDEKYIGRVEIIPYKPTEDGSRDGDQSPKKAKQAAPLPQMKPVTLLIVLSTTFVTESLSIGAQSQVQEC